MFLMKAKHPPEPCFLVGLVNAVPISTPVPQSVRFVACPWCQEGAGPSLRGPFLVQTAGGLTRRSSHHSWEYNSRNKTPQTMLPRCPGGACCCALGAQKVHKSELERSEASPGSDEENEASCDLGTAAAHRFMTSVPHCWPGGGARGLAAA